MHVILWILGIPLCGLVLSTALSAKREKWRDSTYLAELLCVFALAVCGFVQALQGHTVYADIPGLCGMGLHFCLDGFRALYVLIASFMWLMTGLMSPEYFAHYRNRTRYYLFNQITLMATLGLFLSDDLYTTFVFFEIMSLASYPWVAHDETESAMSAARTYLIIAVFGGMVTLMGLFMTWNRLGSLAFTALQEAQGRTDMAVPAALIMVGFAAKAGLFPLYVWLPQAHPVAPAPSSALLSGVLTKTGVFGMLVISLRLMLHVKAFGNVLLALGLITMLLGALLALFSSNLKRVLACSSMSQIGYITVGIAMSVLLGHEGHVPVSGVVMHMVNHSLLKLTLFMGAGVIYMNLHKLELNDIRGFGRGKPLLHAAFLLGSLGLAGVPGFNGYLGKTLIHEGILEYAHELSAFSIYNVCEWIFLFAAGITTGYMLKIYIALFWQTHPKRQAEFDARNGKYMNLQTSIALVSAMVWIPVLGLFPGLLETCARISQGFTGIAGVSGIAYFSLSNLKGGAISLLIGTLTYLVVVRRYLYTKDRGYIAWSIAIRWREWAVVHLAERVIDGMCTIFGYAVEHDNILDAVPAAKSAVRLGCTAFDEAIENPVLMKAVPAAAGGAFTSLSGLMDGIVLFLKRGLFRRNSEHRLYPKHTVYYVFAFVAGHIMDAFAFLLNLTIYRHHPIDVDFTYVLSARLSDNDTELGRVTRSVSFALFLFALGMLLVLLYVLVIS